MRDSPFDRSPPKRVDPLYLALLRNTERSVAARRQIEAMWSVYRHRATKHWWAQFPTNTHHRFWEMYLTAALVDAGLDLGPPVRRKKDEGPDACGRLSDGRQALFEAVCADPGEPGNPNSVPAYREPTLGVVEVLDYPETQVLLRLTNAVVGKAAQRQRQVEAGTVRETAPYVVALNAGALPDAPFASLQPPVLKVLFALGHPFVTLDKATLRATGSGWTQRYAIVKKPQPPPEPAPPPEGAAPNSPSVGTTMFLEQHHSGVSAVLYSDVGPFRHPGLSGRPWGTDFVLIHNPMARNPLPRGVLPRGQEIVTEPADDEMFTLRWTREPAAVEW